MSIRTTDLAPTYGPQPLEQVKPKGNDSLALVPYSGSKLSDVPLPAMMKLLDETPGGFPLGLYTEGLQLLSSVQTPLVRPMPFPAFGVQRLSLANDLQTRSSDFPDRMIARQITEGGFVEHEYVPNITATRISDMLRTDRGGQPALTEAFAQLPPKTELMFVLTRDGELVFGTRPEDVRRPHPTLVGSTDPEVLNGGTISIQNGLIKEIRSDSGHHQPGGHGMEALLGAFKGVPQSLFHPDFSFKPYGADPIKPEWAKATPRSLALVETTRIPRDATALLKTMQERVQQDENFTSPRSKVPEHRRGPGAQVAVERHRALLDNGVQLLGRMSQWAGYVTSQLKPGTERTQLLQAQRQTDELARAVAKWLQDTSGGNGDGKSLEERVSLLTQGQALFRRIGDCCEDNAKVFNTLF